MAGANLPTTYADLKAAAPRQQTRVKAGALAFGGLVALTFGDLSSTLLGNGPRWLGATFATVIVLAGFCLARTFVAFHNCEEGLAELTGDELGLQVSWDALTTGDADTKARRTAADEYRLGRQLYYRLTVGLMLSAVGVFLLNVWWSALAPC
jgi:hypothetical protein